MHGDSMSYQDKIDALRLVQEVDCIYQGQEMSMDQITDVHIRAYKKKQTPPVPKVQYVSHNNNKRK